MRTTHVVRPTPPTSVSFLCVRAIAGDPGVTVDTQTVNSARNEETRIMPEQPKPQPKPQEPATDTRERARAALQMSMDRRG